MEKLLLLTLLVLCLSATTGEAKRRGFKPGKGIGVKHPKHHQLTKPTSIKDETDKALHKDDEIATDFDDKTKISEKVVFAGDDFPGRKRKGGKMKNQKLGRPKRLEKPAKKCRTIEENLGMICGDMFAKLTMKSQNQGKAAMQEKLGKVLECCKLSNESHALECYRKVKLERLNNFCATRNGSSDCCSVEDEDRISCFEKSKLEKCENGHGRNVTEKVNKKGKGRQLNKGKQCCQAGAQVEVGRMKNAFKMCRSSYNEWVVDNDIVKTGMCYKKYFSCCVHQKSTRKPFQAPVRNINVDPRDVKNYEIDVEETTPELPDETGQSIEVTMTMPTLSVKFDNEICCTHGRERGYGSSRIGQKFECLRGSQMLKLSSPQYGTQCFSKYMKCCMQTKRNEKGSAKGKKEAGKKHPKNEMPDGLKRSSSGHYYYVDKIHPDLQNKRNNRRAQKMKELR